MDTAIAAAASPTLSDADLAQHAAIGDDRAFEAIMRRHNRRLFRTARSILKNDGDAEDAVQEAYLQAYRALGRFRGQSSLSTWLVRIVINQALEKLRKRGREVSVVPLDNVFDLEGRIEAAGAMRTSEESPEGAMMCSQTRRLMEEKIDALPAIYRTVFVLRALEDMSGEETAACLGIPEATVRTRFFRARSMLREALAKELDLAMDEAFAFAGERCDRIVRNVLARLKAEPGGVEKPT